jgi:carbamoyl-phosphate synthase large subunit
MLNHASSERQFIIYEAIRKGATIEELSTKTHIKEWFLTQMKELVELEEKILSYKGKQLPNELLIEAKKDGFADKYLANYWEFLKKKSVNNVSVQEWKKPGNRYL